MPDWPHAPVHRLEEAGAYMVTAGTYMKEPFFRGKERLSLFCGHLISLSLEYGWLLQAWAVFWNHYHFIGLSPDDPTSLRRLIQRLHALSARDVNRLDGTAGRKVWHQFWDTHLTFERSYLARLKYVHENPVRHGLVRVASQYPWCSAGWFETKADPAFVKTVYSFKTDLIQVPDDYGVIRGADQQ